VGITGSAGKTTTTALVGRMLDASGFRTWVGGNIGNPLISELPQIRPGDRVVIELSSFQLELMEASPAIAGVLNITPNHLDRHKTMEAYIAAKRAIVAHQRQEDIAVLGFDDANARSLSGATPAQVRYFGAQGDFPGWGAYLSPDRRMLMLRTADQEVPVIEREAIRLRGEHNVMNVLAAIALADAAGAGVEGIRQAIESFEGVPHRLEEVRSLHGVLWVNDSIATAPERVLAALEAFDAPLVLLAGGRDKDLPWERFAERVVARVRVLVLFGEAAPLIREHVAAALTEDLWGFPKPQRSGELRSPAGGGGVALEEIVMVEALQQAVACAAERAVPGEVVLLSPGGTSFDAFRDFAERGEAFRTWVNQLAA
jgi:UDP-N-acetylmuramoylalanine--D-glutamate ligase